MISKNSDSKECLSIGRIAPDFTALSTQGPITMSQYRDKWVVFFSHPGDSELFYKII